MPHSVGRLTVVCLLRITCSSFCISYEEFKCWMLNFRCLPLNGVSISCLKHIGMLNNDSVSVCVCVCLYIAIRQEIEDFRLFCKKVLFLSCHTMQCLNEYNRNKYNRTLEHFKVNNCKNISETLSTWKDP